MYLFMSWMFWAFLWRASFTYGGWYARSWAHVLLLSKPLLGDTNNMWCIYLNWTWQNLCAGRTGIRRTYTLLILICFFMPLWVLTTQTRIYINGASYSLQKCFLFLVRWTLPVKFYIFVYISIKNYDIFKQFTVQCIGYPQW